MNFLESVKINSLLHNVHFNVSKYVAMSLYKLLSGYYKYYRVQ